MLVETQRLGTRPNGNSGLTHCRKGHEFNEENTYISPKSQKRNCRICQSTRNKEQWLEGVEGNREKARLHMHNWRTNNRERYNRKWKEDRRIKKQWLDEQKVNGCSRCPEKDPCCIDFHHTDPNEKEANLSVAIAHWCLDRLRLEMDKCILLCSNCHRKLHAAERAASPKESI